MLPLTDDELTLAAHSYVSAPGYDPRWLGQRLQGHGPVEATELFAAWAQQSGFTRSVGDLASYIDMIETADGDLWQLLHHGAGVIPQLYGANMHSALMSCGGDLTAVAHQLADLTQMVRDYAVRQGANDDDLAAMDATIGALREGPRPGGGYFADLA